MLLVNTVSQFMPVMCSSKTFLFFILEKNVFFQVSFSSTERMSLNKSVHCVYHWVGWVEYASFTGFFVICN